jgi:hypothetical protein
MNHINSDQLREYKFGLLSETETDAIAAHLEHCPDCRQKFQSLEAQFQALEVLRDQPEVSEDRLKAVLVAGRKVGTAKVIPFRPIPILAAVAGIAIAFLLIRPEQRTADVSPSLAELRATQPFAPASNIELNVLPRRDEVQLTIYNAEDLTLVREKRTMTLKRGWNWLQFMWNDTLIDPTSLELTPVSHADQIEITQLVYPPRLNELARWTIFSEYSGEAEFELTYLTSGLKWNANYEATLSPDEKTMQLKSLVRVDNHSGEGYENAQTRLVVGTINLEDRIAALAKRRHPHGKPAEQRLAPRKRIISTKNSINIKMPEIIGPAGGLGVGRKEIFRQALSEYQLYTIEGRESIPDGWGKRLPNFAVQKIGVTNRYKFDEERWGDRTMRFLSFANTKTCRLGVTPLPEGQVRVFKNVDEAESLVYVGASRLQYIPVGEQVELELGEVEKVAVEPKLMCTRSENMTFDTKGNLAGWDEITDWKIEITNTTDLPIEVEVMRGTSSNDWKLQPGAMFEKYDTNHFKFNVQVAAQSKHILEYELTVQHGTRRKN